MTQNEIIFNVKNLLARGLQSDDETLSDRQIAFIIDYYRAKLLKQDADKHQGLSREELQDLGKVPLVQADPHECCEIDLDCIMRTAEKIPSTLELRRNLHGLTFVGTYGGRAFQETTYNRSVYDAHAPFTGNKPRWFFKAGYIYFLNTPGMLANVNIQGYFEDPRTANAFRTCDCENEGECNTGFDFEYPLSSHHVDTIVKMMASSELRLGTMFPEDTDNNAKDDNG